MRAFALMMASLGVATFLVYHFSFWIACGMLYLAVIAVVALLALYTRRTPLPRVMSGTTGATEASGVDDQLEAA